MASLGQSWHAIYPLVYMSIQGASQPEAAQGRTLTKSEPEHKFGHIAVTDKIPLAGLGGWDQGDLVAALTPRVRNLALGSKLKTSAPPPISRSSLQPNRVVEAVA